MATGIKNAACGGPELNRYCGDMILVQAGRTLRSRVVVRSIRIRVTTFSQRSGGALRMAVHDLGKKTRAASYDLTMIIQRRIAVSVCCERRIQSNIIAVDLPKKFPGAVVRRRAPAAEPGGSGELFDFLVLDRDGPKLVYQGCVEGERKVVRESAPAVPDGKPIEVEQAGEVQRTVTTDAIKYKACVNWSSGEVRYVRFQ